MPILAAGLIAACDDGPTAPPDDQAFILDVRVHLLESAESPALTTTLTETEVETVFEGVNEVWSQAGIEWRIESVVREEAENGEAFERMLRGEAPFGFQGVADVIPRANLAPGTWHVFLIRSLGGGLAGVYLPSLPAVLQPELDPLGNRGLSGGLVRILAHELGHALSLPHVPCVATGNLMVPGCAQGVRTRLDESQIRAARIQAATGRPYMGGGPIS